jgi:hypothetical protein
MTFNFNNVNDNNYKEKIKDRMSKIIPLLGHADLLSLKYKLNPDLLNENADILIHDIELDVSSFPDTDNEEIKSLLKLFYIKNNYGNHDFNDSANRESFISLLVELNFYEVEVLEIFDSPKFKELQKFCIGLFNTYKNDKNLTSTYTYRDHQQKEYFENVKYKSLATSSDCFDLIEEINSDFIPYNLDEKFSLIFSIIDYPFTDFAATITKLSGLSDPFAIRHLVIQNIDNLDFIKALLLSDSFFMKCYGLYSFNLFLEKLESNFLKLVRDKIEEILASKQYDELNILYTFKKENISINEKQISEIITTFIQKDTANISIILSFLDKIFRLKNKNFGNQPYPLNSFEFLFASILKVIAINFESISEPRNTFSEFLPLTDKNIIVYGTLIWGLFEQNKGDDLSEFVSNYYFNEFIDDLRKKDNNTNYGFDYEYQHQYLCGLLDIVLLDFKRSNKLKISEKTNQQLLDYSILIDDPFNKTLEEYNLHSKYEYLIVVALELKHQFYKYEIDNEVINDEILIKVTIDLLNHFEFNKIKNLKNNTILSRVAQLALDNAKYKKLVALNISNLFDICSVISFDIDFLSTTLERIEDNIAFEKANLDFHQLYNIYWCFFPYRVLNNLINELFEGMGEHQIFIKKMHENRMKNDFDGLYQVILGEKFHNYHSLKKIDLKSIVKYFEINDFNKDKIALLENLINLLT